MHLVKDANKWYVKRVTSARIKLFLSFYHCRSLHFLELLTKKETQILHPTGFQKFDLCPSLVEPHPASDHRSLVHSLVGCWCASSGFTQQIFMLKWFLCFDNVKNCHQPSCRLGTVIVWPSSQQWTRRKVDPVSAAGCGHWSKFKKRMTSVNQAATDRRWKEKFSCYPPTGRQCKHTQCCSGFSYIGCPV